MRPKSASLLLFLSLLVTQFAVAGPINRNIFTLQVGSFPDPRSAREFASRLSSNGLQAVCGSVELPGRGVWNRVLVGSFKTFGDARNTGESLVARGVIQDFLVKQIDRHEMPELNGAGPRAPEMGAESENRPRWVKRKNDESNLNEASRSYVPVGLTLPMAESRAGWVTPSTPASAPTRIPKPNPVRVAIDIVGRRGLSDTTSRRGGLWLSGDTADGLERLRWIVGSENADLIGVDRDGKVTLDLALVAKVTGVYRGGPTSAMMVVDYLESNEGLLLLVELTQGPYRYRLHLGAVAPTAGPAARVSGSINLDNNFDSRINPYRRHQRKLDSERPPDGFDALIAMNPQARWFNLPANSFVPVAHITFHELAEAHAKVQLGLDYLAQEPRAGAHNLAIEREKILKLQRPLSDVVVTAGSNRVLKLGEELRLFNAEPRRSIAGLR